MFICVFGLFAGKGFAPYEAWLGKTIEYKAKVKLHGQNGAVNLTADCYNVQSRSLFIAKTGKVRFIRSLLRLCE